MRTLFTAFIYALGMLGVIGTIGCAGNSESPAAPAAEAPAPSPNEILAVGSRAPEIKTTDHLGQDVDLAKLRGKKNVVLVFYPGDDTPGCTKQLCTVRDDWSEFTAKDVAVYGISPQNVDSKKAFAAKFSFPFPLIADPENKIISAYGAKGELYTNRTVYAIDKKGKIAFAERGMPSTDKILAALK